MPIVQWSFVDTGSVISVVFIKVEQLEINWSKIEHTPLLKWVGSLICISRFKLSHRLSSLIPFFVFGSAFISPVAIFEGAPSQYIWKKARRHPCTNYP